MTDIKLHHDGKLDIATAKNRHEDSWRNRQILWSKLLAKCSQTHRTHETFAEYLAAKKSIQDEIKDVGGFVGGYLTGGRRKNGNVAHRQLVTLDLDHATPDTWFTVTQLFDCAAACYSTHKHSPDAPRLRILIPLSREVFADEYIAIARWIAGEIGIENVDPTCFRPTQFMYWPSSSKDADYFFAYQDEPWLDADAVLAKYHDWQDSSEWPTSEREKDIAFRDIKKQGDPLEKPGVVGAFCRAFSISEAIERFLDEVYEPCDMEGRYSYKAGSTAGGLVTYEDKYAYSHHGTDPTSGKLCNAFDLVRIHLFGLKDEDAKAGTPGNKLPSYTAMLAFATKDAQVRRQLGSEKIQAALEGFDDDFKDEEQPGAPKDPAWLEKMEIDTKGRYLSTINNVLLILENDPRLAGRLALNTFEKREVALKNLPWRELTKETRYLTDADDASLRHYMEKNYGIVSGPKIKDAMDIVCRDNSFHPVREYLQSLEWDGSPRVESLLIDYMGAEDSPYVRAVTRKTLAAGVARIFSPGIKFDYLLTLVGAQGQKKSSLLHILGREWFSDSFTTVQGKEAYEQIQGVWLVEIAELSGFKKAELESVKHYLSKQEDRYRVAYGRRLENFPRQCFFIGTTNTDDFLRDATGNRRYWPVRIGHLPAMDIFKHMTPEVVDQIWAEAVQIYREGEALYLPAELEKVAAKIQAEHRQRDDREGIIQKYLDTLLPGDWATRDVHQRREFLRGDDEESLKPAGVHQRTRVCIAEIWCEAFGGLAKDLTRQTIGDLHNIMRQLGGWHEAKGKVWFGLYGAQRGYFRDGEEDQKAKSRIADMENFIADSDDGIADDLI